MAGLGGVRGSDGVDAELESKLTPLLEFSLGGHRALMLRKLPAVICSLHSTAAWVPGSVHYTGASLALAPTPGTEGNVALPSSATPRRTTGRSRVLDLPALILLAGTLANLAVIWIPAVVGSVDGGWHLGAASDLLAYLTDPDATVHRYLEPFWNPIPNLTGQIILTGLLAFLEPVMAEKVFLTGYVIGFVLAFQYFVRAVATESRWLVVLAVPLTLSVNFAWGLYNFVWSLIPFLVAAGYLLRHGTRLAWPRAALLGAILLVIYFSHLVSYVEAVLLIACVAVAEHWADVARLRVRRLARLAPLAAAVLPSLVLAIGFVVANGTEGSEYRRALPTLLAGLPSLAWPLVTFDRWEAAFTSLVGLTIGGLWLAAVLARRGGAPHRHVDGLLVYALVATVAYLAAPEATGTGGLISERLALYPVIGVVGWLAGQSLPAWSPRATAVGVAIAMAGLLVIRWPAYQAMGRDYVDYLSVAPCMAPHATIVQANAWQANPSSLGRIQPLVHDAGRLAAEIEGHDLGTLLSTFPLSPLRYPPAIDPFVHLFTAKGGDYEVPPRQSPLTYETTTSGRVDYVVLFGLTNAEPATLAHPAWRALAHELAAGYRLVARSPAGLVDLYERTASPLAATGAARRAEPGAANCRLP